jgi:YHS domain-containing protein
MKSVRRSVVVCGALVLAVAVGSVAGTGAAADKKDPAPKKKQPINTVCPLTEEGVDPAQTVTYQGKLVAFCCEDCVNEFNQDPKKFAKNVEAVEKRAKEKQKEAEKKKKDAEKQKKGEEPGAAKTVNTLCVIHEENAVDPTVTAEYEGKLIGFCCEDCRDKFDLDPASYAAKLKK